MLAIMKLLKEMEPKPRFESITYGVQGLRPYAEHAIPKSQYHIHIGNYPFFYDPSGIVKPINPDAQLGDMWEGVVNLYVNHLPDSQGYDGISRKGFGRMFRIAEELSTRWEVGKSGRQPRSTGMVYFVPPYNNFERVAKDWKEPFTDNFTLLDLPADKEHWRDLTMHRARLSTGKTDELFYHIVHFVYLTAGNKPQYNVMTRAEFLQRIAAVKQDQLQYTKDGWAKFGTPSPEIVNNILKKFDTEKRVIAEVTAFYKNSLSKPAAVHVDHERVIDGHFWIYAGADRNANRTKDTPRIEDIFTEDIKTEGIRLVTVPKGYYESMQDGEIRTLMMEWTENYRPPVNKDHKKRGSIGEPTGYSDLPESLDCGMRTRFAWKKLIGLVGK